MQLTDMILMNHRQEPPEDGEYEWEKEDEDEEEESAKDEEEEMELAKGVVKQEEEKLALCAQQGDGSAMAQMAPAEHAQQPADFAARQRLIAALQQQQKDAEAAQAAAIAKADQSASLAARDARAAQVATEVAEVAAVTTAAAIKRLSNVQVKKEEDEEKGPAPLEWPEAPHPSAPVWGCDAGAVVMAPVITCVSAKTVHQTHVEELREPLFTAHFLQGHGQLYTGLPSASLL